MSKLSFKTFCIEQYADYTNQPSDSVYRLFKRTHLLDLLNDDYEDLHGMGIEWLLNFIDQYLEGRR